MWTGSQLKTNAKAVLKQSYWKALLVSFVLGIVTGGSTGSSVKSGMDEIDGGIINSFTHGELIAIVITILAAIAVVALIKTIFSIFVGAPLAVGAQRYFLESTQYRFNLSELGYSFGNGHYLNIVATMFVKELYLFFWTLLFIIPGVIKGYSYSMVPYILAENPTLSCNEAITISRKITRGHKFNMFLLDLSFFGWYLLGALCFGIGVLFVAPYYNSTRAQLYLALRSIALDNGTISLSELERR